MRKWNNWYLDILISYLCSAHTWIDEFSESEVLEGLTSSPFCQLLHYSAQSFALSAVVNGTQGIVNWQLAFSATTAFCLPISLASHLIALFIHETATLFLISLHVPCPLFWFYYPLPTGQCPLYSWPGQPMEPMKCPSGIEVPHRNPFAARPAMRKVSHLPLEETYVGGGIAFIYLHCALYWNENISDKNGPTGQVVSLPI